MDPINVLELATIIIGIIAALSSLAMGLVFSRSDIGIAKAVAFDKIAETISLSVILVFALAYYFEMFIKMPIIYALMLRLIAISATLSSSIHLAWQTRKIIEGKDEL
jgi:hypothetical protein